MTLPTFLHSIKMIGCAERTICFQWSTDPFDVMPILVACYLVLSQLKRTAITMAIASNFSMEIWIFANQWIVGVALCMVHGEWWLIQIDSKQTAFVQFTSFFLNRLLDINIIHLPTLNKLNRFAVCLIHAWQILLFMPFFIASHSFIRRYYRTASSDSVTWSTSIVYSIQYAYTILYGSHMCKYNICICNQFSSL